MKRLLPLALWAALLLAGCDSRADVDSSGSTPRAQQAGNDAELEGLPEAEREFVEKAGEICRASFERRGKAAVATDAAGVARVAGALLPVYRYRRSQLTKLDPPEDRRRLFDALLNQIGHAEKYLLAAQTAGRKGKFQDADFELRRFTGAQSTAEFLAEQLRIESCAEKE